MKVALVTNIPAPYRIPIYNKIAEKFGDNFLVIYCATIEPNRQWTLPSIQYKSIFLKEKSYAKKDGYNFVHNNTDVMGHLHSFNPDVIITTGYNPTHLYAWFFSLLLRKKHIPMTDGWLFSEHNLSWAHRLLRKLVIKTSSTYIGASKNSFDLFRSYGADDSRVFQSHLCIENEKFTNKLSFADRPYHLMFSGAFHERKLPFFFSEVVQHLNKKVDNLKVLILGDGPLKHELFNMLNEHKIDYTYAGYVEQNKLPDFYAQSKLFLFTTRLDAWGLVANEALASGTPVISTPYTGIINDLLIDDYNGKIIDTDVDKWVSVIKELLTDSLKWNHLSKNSVLSVQAFNFEAAADGIIQASKKAMSND